MTSVSSDALAYRKIYPRLRGKYLPLYHIARALLCVAVSLLLNACSPSAPTPTPTPSPSLVQKISQTPCLYHALQPGLTKEEVATLLPPPQNRDNEFVWMWVEPTREYPTEADLDRWQNLKHLGDGYFVVFKDGKLISPLSTISASDPSDFLK